MLSYRSNGFKNSASYVKTDTLTKTQLTDMHLTYEYINCAGGDDDDVCCYLNQSAVLRNLYFALIITK